MRTELDLKRRLKKMLFTEVLALKEEQKFIKVK